MARTDSAFVVAISVGLVLALISFRNRGPYLNSLRPS